MEKCPNCHEETVGIKTKLSLAPGDCYICPNCNKKLKIESYAYFVHSAYLFLCGLAIFKLSLLTALIVIVLASVAAFVILLKVIPLKVENSDTPYKIKDKKD